MRLFALLRGLVCLGLCTLLRMDRYVRDDNLDDQWERISRSGGQDEFSVMLFD
jgi:hypothetical protein